jgi:hypothetical protein
MASKCRGLPEMRKIKQAAPMDPVASAREHHHLPTAT